MHSQQTSSKMASQGRAAPNREGTETAKGNRQRPNEKWKGRRMGRDLSQDDFIFLLCMLEGELQARDEVFDALKAKRSNSALLEAHYGFRGPENVFQALWRDSLRAPQGQLQDVYEKPTAELDRLAEAQRRSFGRVLEQLAEVEHSHSSALRRLEDQERRHRAYVQESDELTELLERDRERLKLQSVEEKEHQQRKEEERQREVTELREELSEIKAFTLLVVSEQRRLTGQLKEHSLRVEQLAVAADNHQHTGRRAREGAELGAQACFCLNENGKAVTAKMADEDAQSQHLRQRLAALCRQLDELEGTKSALRRAEEELRELRDAAKSVSDGRGRAAAGGTPGLLSEVELLRKRVMEMEGKDEELVRVADQCRDLDRKLGRETSESRSLRAEVDQLTRRISELDRLEEALGRSRQECSALKGNLDRERSVSKQLSGELDALKARVRELDANEQQLGKGEAALRQDLTKLRALTIALVEDRKAMAERLRQAQEKLSSERGKLNEPNTLDTTTGKMSEEVQQALRTKTDLEERVESIAKEKAELRTRLRTEEARARDLQNTVHAMKKKLQLLESRKEGEAKETRTRVSNANRFSHAGDANKVKELSEEVEALRRRLAEKEVAEGDLANAEDDFESLERRYREEQERSQALADELEEAKRELARHRLAEKQEVNQEHLLLHRLQQEQVKSRLLGRELDTLRVKLQKLTGTEESISKVQTDHSSLQKRLLHQETRSRELAREMEALTGELERYRRISKSLSPGVNERRFSDLHQSTKAVQTEPAAAPHPPGYRDMAFSARNGTAGTDSDEDEDSNQSAATRNRSTPACDVNSRNRANDNNNNNNDDDGDVRRYSRHSANGVDAHRPAGGEMQNIVKKGDVVLTHAPGQPLHIKVTPDHGLNTATLEISSPAVDGAASYTSTALIPTSVAPPKQRITIIQNSALAVVTTKSDHRTLSPLASRLSSPGSPRAVTPDINSAVQIVTVSTSPPEPLTDALGQGVLRMNPERHNSWHLQRSNSTSAGPSVVTTEDNKIHIHLGGPYIQGMNDILHSTPQQGGPYYSLRQEQRTQVLTNGCHIKGGSKITSSITITPATSPVSHHSNVSVSGIYD